MSTIIVSKRKYDLPSNDILPYELMEKVFDFMDACSSIYKKKDNFTIVKYDFNTLEIKLKITYKNFLWRYFSVSPCDIFIAVSHFSPCFVSIFNQNDGIFSNIILPIESCEIYVTFIPNGDLLIAQKNYIYHYHLGVNKLWENIYTYEIPIGIIKYITHNSSDMFVCYANVGDIYVFNFKTRELIHAFTDIKTIYNIRVFDFIKSIDFKGNKLLVFIYRQYDIYIYIDLQTKTLTNLEKNPGNRILLSKLLFTPCLTKVLGYSNYQRVGYIWDVLTKLIRKTIHNEIDTLGIFTPGGSKLISEYKNEIKVIDINEL